MAGEIGRFTALIGADAQGLTTGLRGGARSIEQFVKDTQRRFAQIGVGPDFGRAGAKAGRELLDALKGELDNARPLLRQFAESVNIDNRSAVGVIRELVREHERLSVAAGASGDELREIASISRLIDDRELAAAATNLRRMEENAGGAARELRGVAAAIRDAGRGAGGLDAISRRIGQFTEGTGFASTRIQSLERLRATEVALQRALQSGSATLTQRIQLERELARTSGAIADAQKQTLAQALGFGDATRRNERSTNTLTSALGRQILAYASLRAVIQGLRGAFEATDEQERAARRLSATARLTGESFDTIAGFARTAQDELQVTDRVAAELVAQLGKLTSRAQQTATTGQVIIRWMDLAAANGLTLDETLQTIQSTVIGQDEGLKRLGLSNPQQIYERWAKAAGTSASRMSQAQKAQALLNAVVESGARVQGEYNKQLNTALGRQQTLNVEWEKTKAAIGAALASERQFITEGTTGLLRMIRIVGETSDAIEQLSDKTILGLIGTALTEGASGFARELVIAQRELNAAMDQAAKERDAALRRSFVGPRRLPSPIKITAEDNTKQLQEEVRVLRTLHEAHALRATDIARVRELETQLTATINSGLASRERLAELTSIRADIRGILDTSRAVQDLRQRVEDLATAWALTAKGSAEQEAIAVRLLAGYDALGRALANQKDQASGTANELRQQLETLKAMDPVVVELARRQFKGLGNIPELEVPAIANITDLTVPPLARERLIISLGGVIHTLEIPSSVARDAAKKLPPIPVDFDTKDFGRSLQQAIKDLRGAENADVFAKMFGGKEAQIAAQKSLAVVTGNLSRVFEAEADAILRSADSDEVKRKKILELKQAAEALRVPVEGLTDGFDNAAKDTSNLGEGIRSLVLAGRGILSTVDAIGGIGEQARRSLTATLDLVDATVQLVSLTKSGGNVAGKIGAAIGAAGGLIGMIDAVLNNPEAARNKEIFRSNTQALERLSQDLQGFATTPGQLLAASRAVSNNAILNARALTSGFARGFKNVEELDKQLRDSGTSLAVLKRYADDLGISIVDAKGRITAQGLDALNKAMLLNAERMVRFSDSFDDQTSAAALRRRVLGETGADAVFRDSIAVFRDVAPRLFDEFFAGIDVSTKAGREEFRRKLVRFVDEFIAGTIPLGDFGDLDKSTIIRIVNEWLDATEEMAAKTREAAGAIVNFASGFAVAKRVFDVIRNSRDTQSSASVQSIVTSTPAPVPIPATITSGAAAPVVNHWTVEEIRVVNEAGDTPADIRRKVRGAFLESARTISPAAVADVQRALPA